jgi:hypothetical protein
VKNSSFSSAFVRGGETRLLAELVVVVVGRTALICKCCHADATIPLHANSSTMNEAPIIISLLNAMG